MKNSCKIILIAGTKLKVLENNMKSTDLCMQAGNRLLGKSEDQALITLKNKDI